ncbi:MAG: hypothetical protein R3B84_21470 [Zavarzinella sp.]
MNIFKKLWNWLFGWLIRVGPLTNIGGGVNVYAPIGGETVGRTFYIDGTSPGMSPNQVNWSLFEFDNTAAIQSGNFSVTGAFSHRLTLNQINESNNPHILKLYSGMSGNAKDFELYIVNIDPVIETETISFP